MFNLINHKPNKTSFIVLCLPFILRVDVLFVLLQITYSISLWSEM